jgi:uncharacterized protein (DUF58 family)
MKAGTLLGLGISGLVLAGLVTRDGGLLLLALPLIIYLVAGLVFEPVAPQLSIDRRTSMDRAQAGEPVEITLLVTNAGQRLPEFYLEDQISKSITVIEGNNTITASLAAGQSLTLTYSIAARRGLHHLNAVRVTSREPLGLVSRHEIIKVPTQLFVLPEVNRLRRVAVRPPRTGIYAGQIPARQGGPGVEFFGVREYQSGDPMRWINERASARHQEQLFVNEFQQERVIDVGLILDARLQSDTSAGKDSLFEYSVQATAALAEAFLNGGNRVGLFIYGRSLDWTYPGYGKRQRERIYRALARAELGGGSVFEKLEHLPTQLFPVRSQLVLISPLLPDDAKMLIKLRARGYRLMIISPDPVALEQQGLTDSSAAQLALRLARLERDFLLRQLRQARIRVVDWPVTTPFYQIAYQAFSQARGIHL